MKKSVTFIVCVGVFSLLTACGKVPADSERIHDILQKQQYIEVSLGEAYHQEKVLFDVVGEKAVVPENTRWGRPEFREGTEAGIFYGREEGGERYQTDRQTTPELYLETYLSSIENLNLKAGDIKKADYVITIVKKSELRPFAAELVKLTNLVVKNNYELTGVEIKFDRQCRPVRKIFLLQEINRDGLQRENNSAECTQEFSYSVGETQFMTDLRRCKRKIPRTFTLAFCNEK